MRIHKGKRALALAVAAITTAALAACTGAPAPAPTESSAQQETGSAVSPATIRVIAAPVFYEPLYIAEEQGYFADEALTVEIIKGGTAAENAAQLVAGDAEIAMSSGVALITGAVRGLTIRAILGGTSTDPAVVSSGLVVAADSDIASYADLGGKTIAVQGLNSNPHLATLLAAKHAGADPSTLTFVDLPLPNINNAVEQGDVNVGYPTGAFFGQAIDAGLVSLGSPTGDALAWAPNVIYVADDAYVAANEDVIKRFQAAMIKASELARQDNFAEVRAIQKKNTQTDPAVIDAAILSGYQTDIFESGFKTMLEGMIEFKFIDAPVTFEDVVSPLAPIAP